MGEKSLKAVRQQGNIIYNVERLQKIKNQKKKYSNQ
jgi:hypothetical protein